MEVKKESHITVRRLTDDEKEEKEKQRLEQEYKREQLRNIQRERSERIKTVYSGRKKRGIIATIITTLLFAAAMAVQVFVALGSINSVAGMLITAVLVALCFLIMGILKINKRPGDKKQH